MHRFLLAALILVPSLAFAASRDVVSHRQTSSNPSLQAMATQLVDLKAQSLGLYAPLPPAEAMTPAIVADKLDALVSARAYNIQILDGLTASAATEHDRQHLADQLEPARARFDLFAGDLFIQLLTSPVVTPHGWIVPSTFGDAAERQAAELLMTLSKERAFLATLQTRIDALVSQGLASIEAKHTIGTVLDRRTITHKHVGLSPE